MVSTIRPRRQTVGSAGLDLPSTQYLVLTPKMGVQIITTDLANPIPKNHVGLIMGRSSSTIKGLIVHPGVIDEDFNGLIKIMVSSPYGVSVISPGDRIAQLLVLPSRHNLFPSVTKERGTQGFGSTGSTHAYVTLGMDERPLYKLKIQGKDFWGLLDTGADRSIIREGDWPKSWPVQASSQTLRGLGQAQDPSLSAASLSWTDEEGHAGTFQPYVLPLPVSLWGRDILTQMNMKLTSDLFYSPAANSIMRKMGHKMGEGLGKSGQGNTNVVKVTGRLGRDQSGLGFSEGSLS